MFIELKIKGYLNVTFKSLSSIGPPVVDISINIPHYYSKYFHLHWSQLQYFTINSNLFSISLSKLMEFWDLKDYWFQFLFYNKSKNQDIKRYDSKTGIYVICLRLCNSMLWHPTKMFSNKILPFFFFSETCVINAIHRFISSDITFVVWVTWKLVIIFIYTYKKTKECHIPRWRLPGSYTKSTNYNATDVIHGGQVQTIWK